MLLVNNLACLDCVMSVNNEMVLLSCFERSLTAIKSIGASVNLEHAYLTLTEDGKISDSFLTGRRYSSYIQPIIYGKEKFYHLICASDKFGKEILLLPENQEEAEIEFYDYLMQTYALPLMKDWSHVLFTTIKERGYLESTGRRKFTVEKMEHPFNKFHLYLCNLSEDGLKQIVSELLQEKTIYISKKEQKELNFKSMDEYFAHYGPSMVKHLQEEMHPLTELSGEAKNFTVKKTRLYPQQIAQINGDIARLFLSKYVLLNHGMGTGKTISSAAIVEGYFHQKWMNRTGKSFKEALESKEIKYRVILMSPGHLVEKWASTLRDEVPDVAVVVLDSFKKLLQLKKRGKKRTTKEWYIISKDLAKLSYQMIPCPTKIREGILPIKVCKDCGNEFVTPGKTCPYCKSTNYGVKSSKQHGVGLVCPHCGKILRPYQTIEFDDDLEGETLDYASFLQQNAKNSRCYYCDEELWKPHVANIGNAKTTPWIRVTHYTNKAKKGKKTVWIMRDYKAQYLSSIGQEELNSLENRDGQRKYAPAEFIKRYMRGYFDFAIFDEVHECKSGGTGQGHAMHAIMKASKKYIGLTGTISGGYANHLFYLLWRFAPQKMVERGFSYKDELAFSEIYGSVEKTFAGKWVDEDNAAYNVSCKGKQISQPKVKPSISPLIFTHFLLENTTFLDLSDMSRFLPEMKEITVPVSTEEDGDVYFPYTKCVRVLSEAMKDKEAGGRRLMSTALQFSLSYLDHPYGVQPIKNPQSGNTIIPPGNFFEYASEKLLKKEKELIRIVGQELQEGRNCVIYAEYTNSEETCVTYRLKQILEQHLGLKGKVCVIESSSPAAIHREEWMHKKAAEGVKVFITNPACVATGLDFVFTKNGVLYNYPTLIFYQVGYKLFVIWQASRRAMRLNQTKECRVYYMYWEGTAQEKAVQLIAEKQVATAAIQGKFSAEGLAAMANGVDARMKLAESLSHMDKETGNDLQNMFDAIHREEEDDPLYQYKPMLLYHEIIEVKKNIDSMNLFDLMDFLTADAGIKKDTSRLPAQKPKHDQVITIGVPEENRKKKGIASLQLTLF